MSGNLVGMLPEADDELELRDYLRVLQRRKWTIGLIALLVLASSVVASTLQTPVYRSSADVLLEARTTESLFDPTIAQAVSKSASAPTEIRVLESEPVRRIVEDRIGDAPKVSVSNPAETDFLVVAAESIDPARAATVANAYAAAYVEFRRTQAVNDLEAAIAQLKAKVTELDAQIAAGPGAAAARAATAPTTAPDATSESLQRDRDLYASRIDQLTLAATQKTGGAQVVTPAEPSTTPVRPTPARNAVVALFVGLILGVGLAFLRDYLDDSLKTKEDVERAVPGVPVLGLIPALGGWKDRKEALVVSLTDAKSPASEAYRTLRTSVQFLGLDRPLKVIQVTSPSASEGKSTTIANLAVALARAGKRVVVVDADLRRPRIHHFFGLDHTVGLTSIMLGEVTLGAAIQRVPAVDGLYLLASGPVPPNPSEVLAGEACGEVLVELAASCDIVLIDCPPVLPVTDASVLSHRVDGTLVVATAGDTEKRQLHRAVELLGHVNAPLLGVVFNGVSDEQGYGYSYGYRYAYAQEPSKNGVGRDRAPVNGSGGERARSRWSSRSDPLVESPAPVGSPAAPRSAPHTVDDMPASGQDQPQRQYP
ncbi:MAG TPA: polysaccharide biosynthesis tyrosine autokinase [Acidimicrobiales bacterium]|nr:polysaccharide biosynthesis tyrosine autokinase [Acidimicrobiales bacterium]